MRRRFRSFSDAREGRRHARLRDHEQALKEHSCVVAERSHKIDSITNEQAGTGLGRGASRVIDCRAIGVGWVEKVARDGRVRNHAPTWGRLATPPSNIAGKFGWPDTGGCPRAP
jgi:hypothetical protein